MNRIVIIGATGTGKTTLARQIGEKLNIPVTDLDDLHWRPGWVEASADEFRRDVESVARTDRWIIAGNYHATHDISWPRADALIWLDYGFLFTLARLIRRTIRRARHREIICNGNAEDLGRAFSKDSIILWLFRSYHRRRAEYTLIFAQPQAYPAITRFLRLRTPSETSKFLQEKI